MYCLIMFKLFNYQYKISFFKHWESLSFYENEPFDYFYITELDLLPHQVKNKSKSEKTSEKQK